LSDLKHSDAPQLHPALSPEQVEKLSADEVADYLSDRGLSNLNRYAGRPDLLIQENPHRDFSRFEKK
jgi:hypothetical protein